MADEDDAPPPEPEHPHRKHLRVDPKVAAANLAKAREAQARYRREKREALGQAVTDVLDASQLRTRLHRRHLEVVMWHVGGHTHTEIAKALGYAKRTVIDRILKRPECASLVDGIIRAQVERAISGEYGVRAAAKAAAPRVMKRVIEKAGGIEDAAGNPVGMAKKDADAIRAMDLTLTVSGDKVERHAHLHGHFLFAQMTREELRAYADGAGLPERLRHVEDTIAAHRTARALPAPADG